MSLNPKIAELFAQQMVIQVQRGLESVDRGIGDAVSEHAKRGVLQSSMMRQAYAQTAVASYREVCQEGWARLNGPSKTRGTITLIWP